METVLMPVMYYTLEEEIDYPDTDGEPMAESDFQYKYLVYLRDTLDLHFEQNPNIYVSGDLLIYYEEGNPYKSVAPDVFVVFGVPKYDRPIYKIWEEGKSPDVAIEITSKTTRRKDIEKRVLYRQLGVKEYFQYDPTGDYLDPVLQGQRLNERGMYQNMLARKLPGNILKLDSTVLGLELRLEDGRLRLYDPQQRMYLLSHAEERTGRLQERTGRLQEQAGRLQEQAGRLQEQAGRLQAESQIKLETQARIEALARAQAESKARIEAESRAQSLEARLRELEAQLEKQKN